MDNGYKVISVLSSFDVCSESMTPTKTTTISSSTSRHVKQIRFLVH